MKRVTFLISDTGGGHRAAARAIESALTHRFPGDFETSYVDVFREYTPPPMRYAPEIYPRWVKESVATYGLYFRITEMALRVPLLRNTVPGLLGEAELLQSGPDHGCSMLRCRQQGVTLFLQFLPGATPQLGAYTNESWDAEFKRGVYEFAPPPVRKLDLLRSGIEAGEIVTFASLFQASKSDRPRFSLSPAAPGEVRVEGDGFPTPSVHSFTTGTRLVLDRRSVAIRLD